MSSRPAGPAAREDLAAARAADFEESPHLKITRLERTLADERKYSVKVTRQLHRQLGREVREADKRAAEAEKRARTAEISAARAERRALQAEAELETIRRSTTWKAGRAVVALPARLRAQMNRRGQG